MSASAIQRTERLEREVVSFDPVAEREASLEVKRTDIAFRNITPQRVAVELTVHNRGDDLSRPTTAFVSAAPFGAFVPWQPLTAIAIPGLEPGESAVLRTEAVQPAPAPLGPPDRVAPRRLLTALGAEDNRPRRAQTNTPDLAQWLLLGRGKSAEGRQLPADLLQLLTRGNPHWAGNLNVFIGRSAVERHMAQALRIYPGRLNVAMFVLGCGADSYSFHLTGEGAQWDAALYDITEGKSFAIRPKPGEALPQQEWIRVNGQRMLMLALVAPENCRRGAVDVHVVQRSTNKEAVVEFSLDAHAAGAGCYVVE